jgi:hypothetical protein
MSRPRLSSPQDPRLADDLEVTVTEADLIHFVNAQSDVPHQSASGQRDKRLARGLYCCFP